MFRLLVAILSLVFSFSGMSQGELPEYNMTDSTLTDCDGILYDSGGPEDIYANNEFFTLTITSGAPIELTFLTEFCVETDFDLLFIYDGLDDSAPLVATLSGLNIGLPGPFLTNSGSVTLVFTSENSAGYCGWELQWSTLAPPPQVPVIDANPLAVCETNVVPITFSYPLGCDWIYLEDFSFEGPQGFTVEDLVIDCVGDSTISAQLILDQTIDFNCEYSIIATLGIPDICDSIWTYIVSETFIYDQCPIRSDVISDLDSLCAGQCTPIIALVEGCFDHTFTWENGLPDGAGPHVVCPLVTTTYFVNITEIPTGNSAQDSITIEVVSPTIGINDTLLCQSAEAFQLTGIPGGGLWYGSGVQDEETGWFIPDSAMAGPNTIYYVVSDFCLDSVEIAITPIQAGSLLAACPGSDPFQLEAMPAGGTWTGLYTDPDGLFNPDSTGVFYPVYSINGCLDSLMLNVADIMGTFDLDTLCQSEYPDTLDFNPLGGVWYGEGLLDTLLGVFDPNQMTPGQQTLLYLVEGCDQEFDLTILEIQTGGLNKTSCPEQAPFQIFEDFSPPGGFWEGEGIIDTATGLYDPSLLPNDYSTTIIYYAPNGCSDTTFMWNIQTHIPPDTVFFCQSDETYPLTNNTIGRQPGGGLWTGAGIVNPENSYYIFEPSTVAPGEYLISYEKHTCSDTVIFIVYPDQLVTQEIVLCSDQEPLLIQEGLPAGDYWIGDGVIDPLAGEFDPAASGGGEYQVYWVTPAGCSDSVSVVVDIFQQAIIDELDDFYCFQDTLVQVTFSPDSAVLSGSLLDDSFNPANLGEGQHSIYLTYEGDYCSSSDTATLWVYPEILTTISATPNPICAGNGATITIEAGGGLPDSLLSYNWSNDLFPISSNTVIPPTSTLYYVEINDGCSDPSIDSIFIEVLPPIVPLVATSDTACFGDPGWAQADASPPGDYSFFWDDISADENNGAESTAGNSLVLEIIDNENGCNHDTLILIPNYTPIAANFSVNPNAECIAFDAMPLTFIDLSQHGISGTWDFGNDQIEPYSPGSNPVTTYDQAGNYQVSLTLINEGNCSDKAILDVCIMPATPIFVPDVFSPNNDGKNDILYVRGAGIEGMNFMIFDRWGENVFTSTNPDFGWDGQFRGKPMPTAVYVYYLTVSIDSGVRKVIKGDITLVR
ncbi:MAG: gliding motility-associated-like protein [Flavobacteriales bacterium]|jgi:gliding motility-associated-like protein